MRLRKRQVNALRSLPYVTACLALTATAMRCGAQTPTDAVSREISVYNNPAAIAANPTDAVSRDVSVWNNPAAAGFATDAVSRDVSVWNNPMAAANPVDSISRELTVQAGPFTLPNANAKTALGLAGGLATATSAQKTSLNVVTTGGSASRIDLLDAVRLARKASGLDP